MFMFWPFTIGALLCKSARKNWGKPQSCLPCAHTPMHLFCTQTFFARPFCARWRASAVHCTFKEWSVKKQQAKNRHCSHNCILSLISRLVNGFVLTYALGWREAAAHTKMNVVWLWSQRIFEIFSARVFLSTNGVKFFIGLSKAFVWASTLTSLIEDQGCLLIFGKISCQIALF